MEIYEKLFRFYSMISVFQHRILTTKSVALSTKTKKNGKGHVARAREQVGKVCDISLMRLPLLLKWYLTEECFCTVGNNSSFI